MVPRLRRGGFDASGAPRTGVSYPRVICEARGASYDQPAFATQSLRRGARRGVLPVDVRPHLSASPLRAPNSVDLHLRLLLDEHVLLTNRKALHSRLLSVSKARQSAPAAVGEAAALVHEKQLAVLDAVEWAVERWSPHSEISEAAADPRPTHSAHLIAVLVYLDPRFGRLGSAFVTAIIDRVVNPPLASNAGPRLDAKAAAALLTVEVGAFGR